MDDDFGDMKMEYDGPGMDQDLDFQLRINAGYLGRVIGKKVILIGRVTKVEGNGMGFELMASDNKPVQVRLKNPLDDDLRASNDGCLVEVRGKAQPRNTIVADSYIAFPDEITTNFDMAAYDETLELLGSMVTDWRP